MSDLIKLDARGLSCPMPAMMAKKAIKGRERGKIEIIVDSYAARDNVERIAKSSGWNVIIEDIGSGEFRLTISK
ncbi:MAG: sulfurtransferase TusA family protein [Armatimonadota bacterium]|nr:sulfurtransferase TusA family protein [Armatimonadota bacterium]